ncbi:MAG: hypothetical protein JWR35_423 [Marmoricola sp.]|nr:hypothetical protein [Marmoricola sp.]
MAKRKVFWHIGPADLGTAFLAEALEARTTDFADLGILVPGTAAEMRDAGLELRRAHQDGGRTRADVEGTWARIERRIWANKGITLLNTPDLSKAERAQIRLALDGIRGVELHPVLLVRDLPSQVQAGWQSELEKGQTISPTTYAERVLDPLRDHPHAVSFWAGHDLSGILDRWTRTLHAERVHVIAVPDQPDPIWDAFLRTAGIEGITRPDVPLPWSVPGRPALDADRVAEIAAGWTKRINDGGFDMQGSLTASTGTTYAGTTDHLDALATAATEIARLKAQVAALQAENQHLDRKRRKHKRRLQTFTGQAA